jgi:hypothetical protein
VVLAGSTSCGTAFEAFELPTYRHATPRHPGDVDVLAPRLTVDGREDRARPLDMSDFPRALLGETVTSANNESDAILNAIDIILHGSPVGGPR